MTTAGLIAAGLAAQVFDDRIAFAVWKGDFDDQAAGDLLIDRLPGGGHRADPPSRHALLRQHAHQPLLRSLVVVHDQHVDRIAEALARGRAAGAPALEPGLGAGEAVVEGVDQCAIARQIFRRRGLAGAEPIVDQLLALAGERAQFREAEGQAGAGEAMEMALQFREGRAWTRALHTGDRARRGTRRDASRRSPRIPRRAY